VGGFLRLRPSRGVVLKAASVAVVVGIPLTAVGISSHQFIEFIAAWTLVLGGFAFGLTMLTDRRFALPGLALLAALVLAAGYATATTFGFAWLDLDQMVRWHGSANALVFAGVALLVLTWLDPEARSGVEDVDFS